MQTGDTFKECVIEIDGYFGMGVLMGEKPTRAYQMALIQCTVTNGDIRIGTLEAPHLSTTVLVPVDRLSEEEERGLKLQLKEPGIQNEKTIYRL